MKLAYVAMSGGVDSSVAAALLKKQGFNVVGVFMKPWSPNLSTTTLDVVMRSVVDNCMWKEDREDAMRVASVLGIRFKTWDFSKEYKKSVTDYMIKEYRTGRTPNPDVMCNKEIKFGLFFNRAMKEGADYIATGHYVRLKHGRGPAPHRLFVAKDKNKDQSYFLWTLTQDDLSKTIFPVGNLTKPEVRKLARRFGLPNAEKKDSQGLCFVGALDVKEFLSKYIETKVGNVLDEDGKVIGWHHGALFFTIGERHGFTVTNKTPHDKPFYVTVKNMERNTITVSERVCIDGTSSAASTVVISNVNWISGPIFGKIIQARSRYRQSLENMMVESFDQEKKSALIKFEKPQTTLASGQSLVMYDGEVCLGGGVIV